MCVIFFSFFKDFAGTTASRILKFVTNIGYDLVHCLRQNQHPHVDRSLCVSIFFFSNIFFVKDFSGTTAHSILKFRINIKYDFFHRVRETQHPEAYHSPYLFVFSCSQLKYFITDFSAYSTARIVKS